VTVTIKTDESKEIELDLAMDKIFELEEKLKEYEQVNLDVKHHFGGGIYARELLIPKDTVLTGKMHTHEHLNIMLSGDITVSTETGTKRINKPCVITSKPGTKRAGYAHEDTIWITFHATKETDLAVIESIFIADNPQEFIEQLKKEDKICLG